MVIVSRWPAWNTLASSDWISPRRRRWPAGFSRFRQSRPRQVTRIVPWAGKWPNRIARRRVWIPLQVQLITILTRTCRFAPGRIGGGVTVTGTGVGWAGG
jgi:hypothetical protein